ncbi:MAG: hypothetical protein ACN6PJ_28530 [Achromobacter sp.]|uniref:hypothetical protein n=1 Tax=Achromobacter sp. TaxID=134375 RepID=UPI003CFFE132
MSTINDGGPAYPTRNAHYDDPDYSSTGMTLRDFFATHAPAAPEDFGWIDGETDCVQRIVRWNWCYADEMIRARGAQ